MGRKRSSHAAVDRGTLSKTARAGYLHAGRGLVFIVHGPGEPGPQAAYLAEADIPDYFGTRPDLNEKAAEAVARYDPGREFVLLEMERGGEPVLTVSALSIQGRTGDPRA